MAGKITQSINSKFIPYKGGIQCNEERIISDPYYFPDILNVEEIMANIIFMLQSSQLKEQELGFEIIWSIGE